MTTGITQGFRVIPEVTPKWVNNTNVHSKFTLISLFSKIHSLKSEHIHSFLFREIDLLQRTDNDSSVYFILRLHERTTDEHPDVPDRRKESDGPDEHSQNHVFQEILEGGDSVWARRALSDVARVPTVFEL